MNIQYSTGLSAHLVSNPRYAAQYNQFVRLEPSLPFAKLKERYPSEFHSWKDRKSYAKKNGITWDPQLNHFSDFILHLGPIPTPGWTLDRIDCRGGYVLDNLRWASKSVQSANRTIARRISAWGVEYTIAELAATTGKTYDAVRMLLNRHGDSYAQVLLTESPFTNQSTEDSWEFPAVYREELEAEYVRNAFGCSNRLRFFLRLTRGECSKSAVQMSLCSDPERIKYHEDLQKLLRRLHNQAVDFQRACQALRRLRRIEAEHIKRYGHVKVPALLDDDEGKPMDAATQLGLIYCGKN